MFGEFLLRGFVATKSVTNVLSSLRTFHAQFNFPTHGFDHFHFALWKRALPLTRRHVPVPFPAFPLPLLLQLCGEAQLRGSQGLAFASLLATAFFSLARLSSLVPISRWQVDFSRIPFGRDVSFTLDSANLRLKWGKSCQDPSQGFWVPLRAVRDSPACPVRLLRELVSSVGAQGPFLQLFAFRRKAGTDVLDFFTVAEARSWLASSLIRAGLPPRKFTFHSLRRGGCSLAFSAGADRADLQALGGWRSRAIDAYLPSFEARERAAATLAARSASVLATLTL